MAKSTLLDMVQEVLASLDSDTVNSFDDTIESEQVAFIIRRAYYDMINQLKIPEHIDVIEITASGDSDLPTHMYVPDGVTAITSVKYNKIRSGETQLDYRDVWYSSPEDFTKKVLSRNSTASNIKTVAITGGKLLIQTDKAPEYYTSFNDTTLIFDSYDSAVDTTLQTSKFMVTGTKEKLFTLSDTFTPELDSNLFPLLINEAKSLAFVELKQQANAKAEQAARRQKFTWQNDRHNIAKANKHEGPNYGRKRR